MQTWDAIRSRRNVRSFADRPIAAADLDQILEAGRRAPSSQNWQPWDFIVVAVIGPADDNASGRAQFEAVYGTPRTVAGRCSSRSATPPTGR